LSYLLGLDVSTTATKAVLVDENGAVVGTGAAEYPFETPQPLWSEQDPALWWEGTKTAIGAALGGIDKAEVAGIGLTGQMHGMVLLDSAGKVIRPAILWNDQRTAEECDEIRNRVGFERLLSITGNDALTGFTAPKLLWTRNHEPDLWSKAAHMLLPKDYVRFRLTGALATDAADAAGTLLLDLAGRSWSGQILADLEIPAGLLPQVFEGPEITGRLGEAAAGDVGLPSGTPVVAGGGDQAANAVGVGAVRPGDIALSLGTSGVVFATTDRPVVESRGLVHAFCHAVPGRWHNMGVMLSAAGSLRWLRDAIAPTEQFSRLSEEAAGAGPGADGLLFLPYLSGERAPHPDPLARAAFVGLTLRHNRAHLVRAVMEGVAFGLRDGLDLMKAAGLSGVNRIRASGGGVRSPLWRQILADVLEADIVTVSTAEGAAYGAALLAGVAAGWFESVEEAADTFVTEESVTSPDDEIDRYREAHSRYRDLYPALAPTFHSLI